MKKLFTIIGLCCSLILCSCQSTTPTSSTNVSANPVVTASNATATATPAATTPQATATPNTSSSQTIASYYPFNSNKKYTYEGSGNEYAAYTVYTDYTTATRVQFRVNNGGTEVAKVMEISNGELKVLINKAECYYRENFTTTKVATGEVLLKEPLVKGTTWTLSDGTKRYISNVAVSVTTPAGVFNAIEVTTEYADSTTLDYYAQNVGLVKSVFKSGDTEISSTLSKIESNVKLTQTIKFYYPNINDDKIYYVSKQFSFKTNDTTRTILETAYKTVPTGLGVGKVLSTNTKIKSLYLNSSGILYVDFSKELVSEMNAGSGYESMILQSITNTLGGYYGVEKVYITVEGNSYSSGHIYMKTGETFKVNLSGTVSGD